MDEFKAIMSVFCGISVLGLSISASILIPMKSNNQQYLQCLNQTSGNYSTCRVILGASECAK